MRHALGLILTGLGVFLLATGALLHAYVTPRVVRAPADAYQITTMRAQNATYFDAAARRLRTGATITATSTVRGDVPAGHDGIAVWDSFTAVEDLARGTVVDLQLYRVAFDRRTARLVDCCGAAVQGDTTVHQQGIGLFWPTTVAKRTYALFDTQTRRAWPISYDGEERVGGVRTYRFVQHIPNTKVAGDPPDVPGEYLGLGKGTRAVPVDRYYRADVTYWLDPRTGAPVNQRQHVRSELVARKGPGRLIVSDMDLRLTEASQRTLLARTEDGARAVRLLSTTIPLALLLAGAVPAGAGLLMARRRNLAPYEDQTAEPAVATA